MLGQYLDAETGFHYNYHRYYDPRTGRYLSPDPIGQEGGINLYTYVGNNPINGVDILGLYSWNEFMGDWAEVTDIRASLQFWKGYSEEAAEQGNWVSASVGDLFEGLLEISGLLTVQESAEILADPCESLKQKAWAGAKIVGVGASWYGAGGLKLYGRKASGVILHRGGGWGVRYRWGTRFFTDEHGWLLRIDTRAHYLHLSKWRW